MRKLAIVVAAASLALGGCNGRDVASAGSLAVGALSLLTSGGKAQAAPAGAGSMSKEDYDETNELYVSTGKRIVAAVKGGAIAAPDKAVEPDTIRSKEDFCKLAVAGLAQVFTPGGDLKRLDCLAVAALREMDDALGDVDAVRYAEAKGRTKKHLSDMDKILSTAEQGVTP